MDYQITYAFDGYAGVFIRKLPNGRTVAILRKQGLCSPVNYKWRVLEALQTQVFNKENINFVEEVNSESIDFYIEFPEGEFSSTIYMINSKSVKDNLNVFSFKKMIFDNIDFIK
jgi:hypothetical protein